MRNHFTVTLSDAKGAKQYSFKHFVKKIVWLVFVIFLFVWLLGGLSIAWLSQQATELKQSKQAAIEQLNANLSSAQQDYDRLKQEQEHLRRVLELKASQVEFLDESLEVLEELINVNVETPKQLPYAERVKSVQLNALGKQLLMSQVPNGYPVAEFSGVSSEYGYRTHPLTGKRHLHAGRDYRGKVGKDVIATADGVVQYSAFSKKTGYGNMITLVHDNGFRTRYGHLSQRSVKVGDTVRKGQKIGELGNTGRSTGAHLHYEVWFLYHRLDPKSFDAWTLTNYESLFTEVKGVPWASLSQKINQTVKLVEKQLLPQAAKSTEK